MVCTKIVLEKSVAKWKINRCCCRHRHSPCFVLHFDWKMVVAVVFAVENEDSFVEEMEMPVDNMLVIDCSSSVESVATMVLLLLLVQTEFFARDKLSFVPKMKFLRNNRTDHYLRESFDHEWRYSLVWDREKHSEHSLHCRMSHTNNPNDSIRVLVRMTVPRLHNVDEEIMPRFLLQ